MSRCPAKGQELPQVSGSRFVSCSLPAIPNSAFVSQKSDSSTPASPSASSPVTMLTNPASALHTAPSAANTREKQIRRQFSPLHTTHGAGWKPGSFQLDMCKKLFSPSKTPLSLSQMPPKWPCGHHLTWQEVGWFFLKPALSPSLPHHFHIQISSHLPQDEQDRSSDKHKHCANRSASETQSRGQAAQRRRAAHATQRGQSHCHLTTVPQHLLCCRGAAAAGSRFICENTLQTGTLTCPPYTNESIAPLLRHVVHTSCKLWFLSSLLSFSSCFVCSFSCWLWAEISFWAWIRSLYVRAFTPNYKMKSEKERDCSVRSWQPNSTWLSQIPHYLAWSAAKSGLKTWDYSGLTYF